uniref:Aminoacyl tRNA synthase complex-interacting multifunctional protein 2 n=1 Tax=Lygus hesperus TaxID=30085 RepID=A0A0A9YLU8_LYGHE
MTSGSSMYRMKPLFELNSIEINTEMYRMRDINDANVLGVVCNGTAEEDDSYVNFIEGRQEEILKRLKKLRELLSEPIIPSGASPKIESSPTRKAVTKMTVQPLDLAKFGITQDIVLNVNPSQLPYSLLGLKKLWNGVLNVETSCHSHSSVRSLPKPALEFQDKLLKVSSSSSDSKTGALSIRLVWKEVDSDSIFVISPIKSVPIYGEANFLRFLNICIAGKLDPVQQTVLDDKLDSCFALSTDNSKSNVQRHSQNLLSNLNKSKWLMGNDPSVLDLAAWSVISRQSKSVPLDKHGKLWFENCTNLFAS